MPLLTVTNLTTSDISFQDPTGQSSQSFKVLGNATVADRKVTINELAALESQLDAMQAAGNITWSVKDDPASESDGSPSFPGHFVVEEDFSQAPGSTLPAPHAKDLQTANATGDYLADVLGGVYSLATDSTSEAQAAQLTWGDQLMLDPTKGLVFEARVRVNIPGATPSADERWVVGLVSDHTNAEDVLDATTINAWFRGEGANLNIFVETDDNVTNTDDVDSAVDYVDNTWMTLKIDMTDKAAVKFSVNGKTVKTLSMAALTPANMLQPIFCYQRDAGTEVNLLQVDWYRVYCGR